MSNKDQKNKHLEDWRWVNTYPYSERYDLEEEIRTFRKNVNKVR